DRHALNGQRVQRAVQEHRINDCADVVMLEGNIELRYVVRRYRLRRASADQSQFVQVAVPGVLYHTQRKTSVGEQLGNRAAGKHRPVGQHLVNVLGEGLR